MSTHSSYLGYRLTGNSCITFKEKHLLNHWSTVTDPSQCPPCIPVSHHPLPDILYDPTLWDHETSLQPPAQYWTTCGVSGKRSIRAQHSFGRVLSCSASRPRTSTKRQVLPTPSLSIIWNTKHNALNWYQTVKLTSSQRSSWEKMLRCTVPAWPHPFSPHTRLRVEGCCS